MKQTIILTWFLVLMVCNSASGFWIQYNAGGDQDYGVGYFLLDPSTVAYDFTVRDFDLSLTHMGISDSNQDGLLFEHNVLVWDSAGMVVASAVVPQGTEAQLIDFFRYTPVDSPVMLHAGQTYVVGTWYSGGGLLDTPGTWDTTANPHFSSVGANHAIFESDSLEFPNSFNGTNPMWGPTFQYNVVPEPSTYLLMLCGIAVIIFVKRKMLFN